MSAGPLFSAFPSRPRLCLVSSFALLQVLVCRLSVFDETAFLPFRRWVLLFRTATAFHCSTHRHPLAPPPLDFGLGTIVLRTKGFDGKTTLFKGFSGGDSLQRKEEIRYAGPTVSNYSWEVQY